MSLQSFPAVFLQAVLRQEFVGARRSEEQGSAERGAGTHSWDGTVEPIVGASCESRSHARLRGQIPGKSPGPLFHPATRPACGCDPRRAHRSEEQVPARGCDQGGRAGLGVPQAGAGRRASSRRPRVNSRSVPIGGCGPSGRHDCIRNLPPSDQRPPPAGVSRSWFKVLGSGFRANSRRVRVANETENTERGTRNTRDPQPAAAR